jgi:hypothetical protein
MRKTVVVSMAFLLLALFAGAGTIRSKSNITNNRAAAESCKGSMMRTDKGNTKGVPRLGTCLGECPAGKQCAWQKSTNEHGGTRQWCGCTAVEPPTCHTVLVTPAQGEGSGQPSVVCGGECEKGHCKQKEKVVDVIGSTKAVSITCECE